MTTYSVYNPIHENLRMKTSNFSPKVLPSGIGNVYTNRYNAVKNMANSERKRKKTLHFC